MVHGLYGNEDVTWVFARQAGPQWLIVSPRATFPAKDGYSWLNKRDFHDPSAYVEGIAALTKFIENLSKAYPADPARRVLLGFSQGAAMSYLFASEHPVSALAALSGYIPPMPDEQLARLKGTPVLILHGTEDERLSIDVARQDRDRLMKVGAEVTYLEDKAAHKVTTPQVHKLREWLAARL
jgi:phospholipase/carboxylesterase